jgi:transposase
MNQNNQNLTSNDVRRRVVDAYLAGTATCDISRVMGVKVYTVRRIIRAFVSEDRVAMVPRGGNRRSL